MFVLLWLVILSITFCVWRFDVRVAMIGYIVHHFLCLEIWCSCCYDWLYCRSRSVFGGWMFVLLWLVILSITFCAWGFDVRVAMIGYIVDHVLCVRVAMIGYIVDVLVWRFDVRVAMIVVHHVLCLEVWCSCCYDWLYCRSCSVFGGLMFVLLWLVILPIRFCVWGFDVRVAMIGYIVDQVLCWGFDVRVAMIGYIVDHVLCLEVWCSCCYDWLYCRSRSVFGGLMFVLLWLVILSITFCVWRFDVRVAMIGYIVDHVLCLEVWCSCCYDWLYCRSRSVFRGLMFVLLWLVILSITFCVWRFDIRVAMIGYIVHHVLCLEVWCSCCYDGLYCRSRSCVWRLDVRVAMIGYIVHHVLCLEVWCSCCYDWRLYCRSRSVFGGLMFVLLWLVILSITFCVWRFDVRVAMIGYIVVLCLEVWCSCCYDWLYCRSRSVLVLLWLVILSMFVLLWLVILSIRFCAWRLDVRFCVRRFDVLVALMGYIVDHVLYLEVWCSCCYDWLYYRSRSVFGGLMFVLLWLVILSITFCVRRFAVLVAMMGYIVDHVLCLEVWCSCCYDWLYCRSRSVFGGLMFVLLWLVILSITFCVRRFDVLVAMIGYIVDHFLCLEIWCSCCYDWLYCRSRSVFGGWMFVLLWLVILSIRFCAWRFDVRVAMIGYIVDHVLCLEVGCSCCYDWLYCRSGSVLGGLMFVLLWLVILSITFCAWRFDVRVAMIAYIVHHVLCLEVWCSCSYDWLYCRSGSVFGGLMFVLLWLVILSIRFCAWGFDVRVAMIGYIVDHVLCLEVWCSCCYDWLYCRSRSVFGGLMFVLLWLVILSITFCVWRLDVRVAMIGYIVDHVLCLEVGCSCCYDWLYCPSRSVFGGLMFVLLWLAILSITFCVWRFDVRVAMIGYIVHHVLCLEVWCSCCYDGLYCRSRSVFGGWMFVLLWLVILSITFCVWRFDVRVAMIGYIVHHVLWLEVWCSCCYDWLYCPSRSVFGGLMFVLLWLVILSITFCV